MKTPSQLPWWSPLPLPVLAGVLATWIPLSVPAMVGLLCGVLVYSSGLEEPEMTETPSVQLS